MKNIQDDNALYTAFKAHDPRFDGVFYVGVTSTGIYCRPVCTARTPKQENCHFFTSAAAAEKASFRPCLRCRPELAPGSAPVDDAQRIARQIADRLETSLENDESNLEHIAAQYELSSRQIRRIIQKEFGVSPIELLQTRRLLLAKQLLTETALPVTEIAFASGFGSLRRFNDAFLTHYGMPPTQLRKNAAGSAEAATKDHITLQLSYRPPYDWETILCFLEGRAMKGVEHIEEGQYCRSVRLSGHTGWLRVRHAPKGYALQADVSLSLTPVLPALLHRLRNLFDLAAQPEIIEAHLKQSPLLKQTVTHHSGLRVPGAFDGFELAVRAILGQQVTVKAATTFAGRVSTAFGEKITTPWPGVSRLSPTPERIAALKQEDLGALSIIRTRCESILALAREMVSGRLKLDAGTDFATTSAKLTALPGIGAWTAHYIAMRALRWPDAFVKEDIAVRNALGGVTPKQAEHISQAWRPWRSYAVLHLWHSLPKKGA
ncbi:MAG TPA: AlkA N-terminal domain-containing protein [Rickettsiales bacterium]|nr:AlkA N-terminal domain-containing protein [Rickettsiales bacterium]